MNNNFVKKYHYNTPIGNLWIAEKQNKIYKISFFDIIQGDTCETTLIKETFHQLNEYFNKKRQIFDVPLLLEGTDFQLKVWKELMKIPYGQTASYKDIATSIGNPKACRAVGLANNKNKIIIIIPCHRIIGSNGQLTGFAGGLNTKKYLLNLEKN